MLSHIFGRNWQKIALDTTVNKMSDFEWWVDQFLFYLPEINSRNIVIFGIIVLCSFFIAVTVKKRKYYSEKRFLALFAALLYYDYVLMSTLIARKPYVGEHIRIIPFWIFSQAKQYGIKRAIREVLFNIMLFMPLGTFLGIFNESKEIKLVFIQGFLASFFIEMLQMVSRRGVLEFDDLLFNTLGALLGCAIVRICRD